jgi:hypothetical protein
MKKNRFAKIVKFVVLAAVFLGLLSFVVMRLWNWLMPELFGLSVVTYWQALGLLLLSKILFGGLRGGRGGRMFWRRRMMERWEKMTPEEREKFRQGLRGRCGPFEPPAEEGKD